ncbi:MAG: hypothetical protein SFV51_23300, partial [Bryobacteraceae bacterium]|nr:hypothetical protein [Bryobacteraceae bacterium]
YRTATTAGFTELSTYARMVLHGVPPSPSVELMVHPGAAKYDQETALLESGWAPEPSLFRLIPYTALT